MQTSHIALAALLVTGLGLTAPAVAEVGAEQTVEAENPTNADYVVTSASTEEDETAEYLVACTLGYLQYPQPCVFPYPQETVTQMTVEIWTETNGCDGLQTSDDACGSSDTLSKEFTVAAQGL
jgi:hypothetical protein